MLRRSWRRTSFWGDKLDAASPCCGRASSCGYLRREEMNDAILALWKDGVPIKQIVRRTGHHRQTVRRIIRGERSDVLRSRQSSLEAHLPWRPPYGVS